MEKVFVIKIGGNVVDNEAVLNTFLKDFATVEGKKILVHGGGKIATQMAAQLNIPQQMIEGRRITDAETLKIVAMVYAGYINKTIVARLQANGCNAIGLSGADGNLIKAHKRMDAAIDFGFVGDIDAVNTELLDALLQTQDAIIIAPITHDAQGQLLNTNADTIAQEVAKALGAKFEVELIYCFEKPGVLLDADNDNSLIAHINKLKFEELKETKAIFDGMIPKLTNAFTALDSGVKKVIIGNAAALKELIKGNAGTGITH
jgi:acetylglutamate kinase